ncbi:MAG: tetratricopeptide repeat protein [Leptospirales bacterium]
MELQKEYMAHGQHYLAEGKTNEAVIEFQNLLKVNPKSAVGHYELGKAYHKKGWVSDSVIQFRTATKLDPLMLPAHVALARYAVNSGQWGAAKSEISTILKIDPSNVEGWTFSGQRNLGLGREDQAEQDLKHALSIKPGYPLAQVALGDIKRKQNHPRQATAYYENTLASAPLISRAWTGLGLLAQSEGKNDLAMTDFKKAISVDPTNLRSHIILSNFLASQSHLHKAISELESIPAKHADLRVPVKIAEYETMMGENQKAISLLLPFIQQKLQVPDIDYVVAKAYEQSGKRDDALQMVNRLLEIQGVPLFMVIGAARIELVEGNPEYAQKILEGIKGGPNLPVSYAITRSQVELALNNPKRAIMILDEALTRFPKNANLLLTLAEAFIEEKKWKLALKNIDRVLQLDPKNISAIARKGALLGKLGSSRQEIDYLAEEAKTNTALEPLYLQTLVVNKKTVRAISEAQSFLSTHPNSQPVRLLLSRLYTLTGKAGKAETSFKSILAINPKNLPAILSLASISMSNHHYPEAESYFRRALRISPDNGAIYSGLGESLLGENQRDAATKAFETALTYNPNDPAALLEVAKSEVMKGDAQGAMAHLKPLLGMRFTDQRKAEVEWLWGLANERKDDSIAAKKGLSEAVRLDPKNAAYHASLGDFWASLSQWKNATREYSASLSLYPDNTLLKIKNDWIKVQSTPKPDTSLIQSFVRKANSYRISHPQDITAPFLEAQGDLLLKKPEEAMSIFDSILSTHPNNTLASIGKSGILLAQGHLHKAKEIVERILSDHPNNFSANIMMANIDQKTRNPEGEAEHLEKIRQLHPDWLQPSLELAQVELSLKHFQEAKSISGALLATNSNLDVARFQKSQAELGLGEYKESIRDLRLLATRSKNPAPFYTMLSVASMKLGDQENEKHYLDLAFKASPNDPTILNNMAFYLASHTNHLSSALDYAEKAVALDKHPYIQDTLGYIFFKMRNYQEAQVHFESAWNEHFRDPEFLYHLGMNEWKLGEKNKAEKHLREAMVSGSLTPAELSKARNAIHRIKPHGA